jgi:hypothetical protein
MRALDGRKRDALHLRVGGARGKPLVEALGQPSHVALAETARATVLAGLERLQPACLVLASKLPEPLGRETERLSTDWP